MNRLIFRVSSIAAITLSLSACTGLFFGGFGENNQSLDEFTRYVEQVFKLQNSLTSELMLLQESDEKPKNLTAILQAEQVMQTTCAPLNDYAALDVDGLSASLALKRRVEKSAGDCEKAANKVKSLLAK